MSEWHCFKCKVEAEEDDITLIYMNMLDFHPGLICPKCGLKLIQESVGWSVVRKKEEKVEAKMV